MGGVVEEHHESCTTEADKDRLPRWTHTNSYLRYRRLLQNRAMRNGRVTSTRFGPEIVLPMAMERHVCHLTLHR